jgi:hypothetical protein
MKNTQININDMITRAFAADAAPLQADFIACEMPAIFLRN